MFKEVCVTLASTPERRKLAENHFKERGRDVAFYEGFDNHKLGLRSTIPTMYKLIPYFMPKGQVGCYLSHYSLWKALLFGFPTKEAFIIYEDDVELPEDFQEQLDVTLFHLPKDWEFVYLGHCCNEANHNTLVKGSVYKSTLAPMCTHAYMVKASAIPKLIETNDVAQSHIDIQLRHKSMPQMNYYLCVPSIASQKSIDNPDGVFKSLTIA